MARQWALAAGSHLLFSAISLGVLISGREFRWFRFRLAHMVIHCMTNRRSHTFLFSWGDTYILDTSRIHFLSRSLGSFIHARQLLRPIYPFQKLRRNYGEIDFFHSCLLRFAPVQGSRDEIEYHQDLNLPVLVKHRNNYVSPYMSFVKNLCFSDGKKNCMADDSFFH